MSYLPRTDAGVLSWSRNFQSQLGGLVDPAVVGLTLQNVTDYTAAQADYETKYNTAQAPNTRGGAAILAKKQSKEALVALSRSFAMTIANFQGVTDQQRYDFGLTVRDTDPTPVPPPTVAPEIDFLSTGTRTIRIRLHNESTLSTKKPDGVKGASIFYHIGETAPAELSEWTFHESVTKTTLDVDLPASVEPGTKVWFTAFWFNPRQQSGPATTPVSTIVQYGGLAQAA